MPAVTVPPIIPKDKITFTGIVFTHLGKRFLISDSVSGLQKLLDGLLKFCSRNLMIVNELKTKVLAYGTKSKVNVHFNGDRIEQVENYKYLGNILNTTSQCKSDIFAKKYNYLSGQVGGLLETHQEPWTTTTANIDTLVRKPCAPDFVVWKRCMGSASN